MDMDISTQEEVVEDCKRRLENEKFFRINFGILKTVHKLQQQNGLRHNDYQRYRSYCSRRLRRLRKTLQLPQGDKRHFKKKPITEHILTNNERAIHIPLMLAERAWSHAMQLKLEANTEPRKKFHVVSRLRKAVKYAEELQQLCESEVFEYNTKLESEAYACWMRGIVSFEVKDWQTSIENLQQSKVLYERLITIADKDDAFIFNKKMEELTPSIRYCAYNMGSETHIEDLLQLRNESRNVMLKNITIPIRQTSDNSDFILNEKWQGQSVVVNSEKVRVFLLSYRELQKRIDNEMSERKVELLEEHLIECKDIISSIQDDMKQHPSQDSSHNIPLLQHLLSYLNYLRITITISRNLVLVESAKRNLVIPFNDDEDHVTVRKTKNVVMQRSCPRDIARLYEIILQNLAEMEQINELDDQLATEILKLRTAYNAFRCYYIGLELFGLRRWDMVLVLYNQSLIYANDSYSNYSPLTNLLYKSQSVEAELLLLIATVKKAKCTISAHRVIHGDYSQDEEKDKQHVAPKMFLLDKLQTRRDNFAVNCAPADIRMLPTVTPLPFKALYFDLALNYMRFPYAKKYMEKKPIQRGFSKFVQGIWGWSS